MCLRSGGSARSFSKKEARERSAEIVVRYRAHRNYVDWWRWGEYGETGIFMGKGFHSRSCGMLFGGSRKEDGKGVDGVEWFRCLKKDISNDWDESGYVAKLPESHFFRSGFPVILQNTIGR
jgi:hypothetical protein